MAPGYSMGGGVAMQCVIRHRAQLHPRHDDATHARHRDDGERLS